jgi:hypothetical protein
MAWSTFSSRWKRIGSGIALTKFVVEFGRYLALEPLYQGVRFGNIVLDLIAMIVVVGQCRVHFCQRQLRVMGNNLLNRIPQTLLPDGDVLHADTVARNTRFPAARPGREDNMLSNERRDMLFVG